MPFDGWVLHIEIKTFVQESFANLARDIEACKNKKGKTTVYIEFKGRIIQLNDKYNLDEVIIDRLKVSPNYSLKV